MRYDTFYKCKTLSHHSADTVAMTSVTSNMSSDGLSDITEDSGTVL